MTIYTKRSTFYVSSTVLRKNRNTDLLYTCIYIYIHMYELNLQTVLFRPLMSHQCSSEWFENWDMSIAQRTINTSDTDKQWHMLFVNTRVLKLKRASNA